MSKQLRFYMTPQDTVDFLSHIRMWQDTVIISPLSTSDKPKIIAEISISNELDTILFWNTSYAINCEDIRKIHRKRYQEETNAYIETGEIIYLVNTGNSPVIEFSPSRLTANNTLTKGRIWVDLYRLEGRSLVYKGQDFERWYNRVARFLRGNLKRIKGIDGYFGFYALQWYHAGGQLG